jgi:hypothetical protein
MSACVDLYEAQVISLFVVIYFADDTAVCIDCFNLKQRKSSLQRPSIPVELDSVWLVFID